MSVLQHRAFSAFKMVEWAWKPWKRLPKYSENPGDDEMSSFRLKTLLPPRHIESGEETGTGLNCFRIKPEGDISK